MVLSASLVENYQQPSQKRAVYTAINRSRKRLADFPVNPVLWTNLALLFTTIGEMSKAGRAMAVALQLAPENRFVLRAACRHFIHQGDLDRAHAVLLQSAILQADPWVLASEVAVAASRKRDSKFIKKARSIAESEKFAPFHVSELTGALATLEATAGNRKKANRYCSQSLAKPAENAIAQAAWLNRQGGLITCLPQGPDLHSSEANAWVASRKGDWSKALTEANKWQEDQPFSSRPAQFGTFVASTAIEDFDETERIARQGLLSNHDDATLHNNLAFALANQGRLPEADAELVLGFRFAKTDRQHICLTATQGLIQYRSRKPAGGRLLYDTAAALATAKGQHDLARIATVYCALEEARIPTSAAVQKRREAEVAASKLSGTIGQLFLDKLRRSPL
jgi:tetratricopeptide (TPR) repeat protein